MEFEGYLRRNVISRSVVPHVISTFQSFRSAESFKLCDERITALLALFDDLLAQLEKGRAEFQVVCSTLCGMDAMGSSLSTLKYTDLPLLLELEDTAAKRHFDELVCEFLKVSFALHERSCDDQSLVFDPDREGSISQEALTERRSKVQAITDALNAAGMLEAIVIDKLENVVRELCDQRVSKACQSSVKECNIQAVRQWIDSVVSDWLQANGLKRRAELRLVLSRLYVSVLTCLVRERTGRIYEMATRFERARAAIRELGDAIAQLEAFVERDSSSRETDGEPGAEEDEIGVLCFLRDSYSRLTEALLRGVRDNLLNASRTTHEILAMHVAIVRLLAAIDRAVDERCSLVQRAAEDGGRSQREPRRTAPRFVDTIGNWVAEPIRLYLRLRTDAIRCVIRALRNADATASRSAPRSDQLGKHTASSSRELDKENENRQPHSSDSESDGARETNSDEDTLPESEIKANSSAPISGAWLSWQPRRVRFETVAHACRTAVPGDTAEPASTCPRLSAVSKRGESGNSSNKRKLPSDAARRTERESETARIIGSLVALFGTDEHFVNEYRNVLADSLLAGRTASRGKKAGDGDDSDETPKSANEQERALQRERRAIRFLKRRFGAAKLRECDVMLSDVAESGNLRSRICTDQDSEFRGRMTERVQQLIEQTDGDADFRFEPLIISGAYWPTLKEGRFSLPGEYQTLLDEFSKCYQILKPNRSLEWRTQLGTMTIEVECESDSEQSDCASASASASSHRKRTLQLTVSSAQACLLKAFENRSEWSIEELAEQFGAPISATRNRLSLFVRHGLIRQVDTRTFRLNAAALANDEKQARRQSVSEPNRFVRADETADDDDALNCSLDDTGVLNSSEHADESMYGEEDDEDEECGGESAVQTNDERNEEALSTAFAYVVGMLRQLNEVTFERIATMLGVFLPHITARCDNQALKSFLDAKVRLRELVFANGAYRLPS